MTPLSAIIITKNEEPNIGRCLDALAGLADEIIVVDSGSTDKTVEIAVAKGAKVVFRAFDNFRDQKNFGIAQASFPHIFSLDADEVPDETLRQSIISIKKYWVADGYRMKRLTNYAGKWIWHSGWYPDSKLRIIDTRLGNWAGKNPHEKMAFFAEKTPKTPLLDGNLLHFSFPTVESHWRKAEFYSSVGAKYLVEKGRKIWFIERFIHASAKWIKMFLFRRGFLDGRAGWTIARIGAWETFQKYKKAYFLRQK
jgi:glycosyltransferase involved in cell wall biosynthesis